MKTLALIQQAVETYKATKVFALFSGGNDSLVSTHIASQHPNFISAVHIDTGIGIPETQEFVVKTCEAWGIPLKIYRATENTRADGTPDPQIYEDLVLAHGFPSPPAHNLMYRKLKERQLERLMREVKTHKRDNVVLVSGVRIAESDRRKHNIPHEGITKAGCSIWVCPIKDFTSTDCKAYINHHSLQTNPVKELLCMSGECLCGAFAKPGELAMIEAFYPEVGKRLRDLEAKVEAAGHKRCKWDVNYGKAGKLNQPSPPLCTSCVAKFETQDLPMEFSNLP